MKTIYEPVGRAREFSPLALNIYSGCDHRCLYCYQPIILRGAGVKDYDHSACVPRRGLLEALYREAPKFRGIEKQVLLSFSGDPYCQREETEGFTRKALEILLKNRIPVSILTKGGRRCLRSLDLFRAFPVGSIQVGATLVFADEEDRERWEPGAAPTEERIAVLQELRAAGIRTWASFEPVIFPGQSLALLRETIGTVEHVKVGKINYEAELPLPVPRTDWQAFLREFLSVARGASLPVYVKNSLSPFSSGLNFWPGERDPDNPAFQAKPFPKVEEKEGQGCLFDF